MADPFRKLAWDDFRLVRAVAEAQGLTGAAAALGIAHSTVFRRLGQIEESLGTRLFERHRTGYAPTPAGEEMVALAERVDGDIRAFTRRVAGQEIQPAGELRVTTSEALLVHLLTPILAAFQRSCPEVRLDVVTSDEALNLSKRDADVAIRATEAPPEALVGRRAARIGWALYGPRESGAIPTWAALNDAFSGLKVVKAERREIPPERLVYRLNSLVGLAEAIAAGIGVGHLPCFIGDGRADLIRLSDPIPEYAADLWLLTHPELRHSARVRVFLDFVAGEIRKRKSLIEGTA
ncbi:LysR family transcriptional regulator [Cereibacter sphaeroides]|uniref:LysR family transcriptional regulator n=1 Tax=Cereibacter sphaeroides TaxID=1063 RepID=UPI001F406ABF|nr:LysR family transcriptional regulator [Cereibacter sphaeroides]MCE6957811.1 LysR family transcriptional regulator [Cereibacter sphaeroides]MCE6969863.1 LysR family transcriptional regulator [Cereibacter sphaeroides]MCE6971705.1 LysR family transcriptional regulator [Cereibacter sphaeroides]